MVASKHSSKHVVTGVSAFAFQGTNAHALLSSCVSSRPLALSTRRALQTWTPVKYWYTTPGYALVERAFVPSDGCGEVVEAHISVGSPRLSLLHAFQVEGRTVIPVSVLVEMAACLAEATSLGLDVSASSTLGMTEVVRGLPILLQSAADEPLTLSCHLHAALGVINVGHREPRKGQDSTPDDASEVNLSCHAALFPPLWSQDRQPCTPAGSTTKLPGSPPLQAPAAERCATATLSLAEASAALSCFAVTHPGAAEAAVQLSGSRLRFDRCQLATIEAVRFQGAGERGAPKEGSAANGPRSVSVAFGRCRYELAGVQYVKPQEESGRVGVRKAVSWAERGADPGAPSTSREARARSLAPASQLAPASCDSPSSESEETPRAFHSKAGCSSGDLPSLFSVGSLSSQAAAQHDLLCDISTRWSSQSSQASQASAASTVAGIVCGVLGCEAGEVGSDDPLIGAGLDSIAAIEIRTRLQDSLGVQLPASLLQEYPTLASLVGLAESFERLAPSGEQAPPDVAIDIEAGEQVGGVAEGVEAVQYLPLVSTPGLIEMARQSKARFFLPIWFYLLFLSFLLAAPFAWLWRRARNWSEAMQGCHHYKVRARPLPGAPSTLARKTSFPLTCDDVSYSHVYVSADLEFDRFVSEGELCDSLATALGHFPALGGNLQRRGRSMWVTFGGKKHGVKVRVQEIVDSDDEDDAPDSHRSHRSDISQTPPSGPVFHAGMIPPPTGGNHRPGWLQSWDAVGDQIAYAFDSTQGGPWSHRALEVRITHLSCQGGSSRARTLLSVRWNHAVADGGTVMKLLDCWARVHRGEPGVTPDSAGPEPSPRQHALLASLLLNETRQPKMYFPRDGAWSKPFGCVLIKFTPQELALVEQASPGRVRAIDAIAALLWVKIANACLPPDLAAGRGRGGEAGGEAAEGRRLAWHPRVSFLVDLRHQIPELERFSGNLLRCLDPWCPVRDPVDGLPGGEDLAALARVAGEVNRGRRQAQQAGEMSMRRLEEQQSLPGVPLCMQSMQNALMQTGRGPCLLMNDLTSFTGPFRFGGNATAHIASNSQSDWSPGDPAKMSSLPSADLTGLEECPFWFAFVKSSGEDYVCSLTTFS